jgi:type VI secretion system protein ImpM
VSTSNFTAGFYGKIPSHGDFLSRRLPRQFIEPWDQWLQGGLAASREQLGQSWLDIFLVSPIWQFALSPGLCGNDAWAGVMMPSVDKVGRYFPLMLATQVNDYQLTKLFDPNCGWFAALSQLALSSLDYEFDLQSFDEQLERLSLGDFLSLDNSQSTMPMTQSSSQRLACLFQLESNKDTQQAFDSFTENLGHSLTPRSYWRSTETEDTKTALLICEGMPPIDAYIGFLNGDWPQRGWHLTNGQLNSSSYSRIVNENTNLPDLQPEASQLSIQESSQSLSNNSVDVIDEDKTQEIIKPIDEKTLEWESCAISVVGLRRKINEDAILDRNEAGLWAVADGMGGHSAGDVASQALVAALAQVPCVDDLEYFSEQVASCLHNVNRDLLKLAESRGFGQIIGSTVVVLLISGLEFHYLWAGDSRLYRYRQGRLEQLTIDHSLYNESISLGLPLADGSLEQGRGNVITRAVGADTQLLLDYGHDQIEAEDIFILCSDGLDKELNHEQIEALCGNESAHDLAHKLVNEAEGRGGRDNISVIVVKAVNRD